VDVWQNDSLFGPELVTRMHDAFEQAGGRARLVEYAAFKRDSHGMLASRDGQKVWLDDTMKFLDSIGMPTKVVNKVPLPPVPQATNFAGLDDADAVPFLSENGKRAYREYLTKMTPRAFAVSPAAAGPGPRKARIRKRAPWRPARPRAASPAACIRSTAAWCGIRTWPRRPP
jgi:hypothetical protein